MHTDLPASVCWVPLWNERRAGVGLEHLLLGAHEADSVVLGIDRDAGAFRLAYRLTWDSHWRLRSAELRMATAAGTGALSLRSDGCGSWTLADATPRPDLAGCIDIDVWPTPFTNTFPLRRAALRIGERRTFRMAWVSAFDMAVQARPQAYTRLEGNLYRFEELEASGFQADLGVDEDGLVVDYPGLFRRVERD